MNKRILTIGFLLGLIFPFIGIFLGLQVSTTLGNVFAFPFVLGAMISGIPFGEWSTLVQILVLVGSGLIWAAVFSLVSLLFTRRK